MKKYIPLASIVLSIGLFTLVSQPKTVTSSQASSFTQDSSGNHIQMDGRAYTMPTSYTFKAFSFYDRNNFFRTSTPRPTVVASAVATPKATTQATNTATTKPSASASAATQIPTSPTGSYQDKVITLVNNERAKSNLPALIKNSALTNSAESYALRMGQNNFFSHTGDDGSSFVQRNTAAGYTNYTWLGENIAAGQQTPEEVMQGWMNSSGHRANILSSKAKEIGVGYAAVFGSTYGKYWVQEFGAR